MARDERAEPGELEDLGGAPALDAAARLDAPDEADRARLLGDDRADASGLVWNQRTLTPSPTLYEDTEITHKPKN